MINLWYNLRLSHRFDWLIYKYARLVLVHIETAGVSRLPLTCCPFAPSQQIQLDGGGFRFRNLRFRLTTLDPEPSAKEGRSTGLIGESIIEPEDS
jgi:hypothetical protein